MLDFDDCPVLGAKILYSGTANDATIEEWRSYLGFAEYEGQVERHRAVLAVSANRLRSNRDVQEGLTVEGWTRDGTPMRMAWDYFNGEWVTLNELAALYRCDVADVLSYRQFAKHEAAKWVFDDADHLNTWTARRRDTEWENSYYPGHMPAPRGDFPPHKDEGKEVKEGQERKTYLSGIQGQNKEKRDLAAHEARIKSDMAAIEREMGRTPHPSAQPPPPAGNRFSTRTRTRTGKALAIEETEGIMPTAPPRAPKGKGKGKGKGKEVATDAVVDLVGDAGDAAENVGDAAQNPGEAVGNAGDANAGDRELLGEDSAGAAGKLVVGKKGAGKAAVGKKSAGKAAGGKKRKLEGALESIEEGDEPEEDLAPPAKRSRVSPPDVPAADTAAGPVAEEVEMVDAKEATGKKNAPVKEKKKGGRKPATKKSAPPPSRVTRSMSRQRSEGPHGVATDGPSDAPENPPVNVPADRPVRRIIFRQGPGSPVPPSVVDGPSDNASMGPPAPPAVRRSARSQRNISVTAKAAELQEGGKWKKGAK